MGNSDCGRDAAVLVVFREVPEDLRIYKLTLDKTDLNLLRKCHGLLVGEEGMPESLGEWLVNLVTDEIPLFSVESDNAGWPIILQNFSGDVIVTGIWL